MLSIDILRNYAGLSVPQLCAKAHIPRSTYYNISKGDNNISEKVLERIGKCLNAPYINALHFLDRLYQSNIKIMVLDFPDIIPPEIQDLLFNEHPIFMSKYNGHTIINQGIDHAS